MLLYWHHYARNGRRIEVEPTTSRSPRIFCTCCTERRPAPSGPTPCRSSLILYAEHEFNASTFTARVIAGTGSDLYSCIAGAIGALKGPKHGGANEVALEIQKRYRQPTKRRRIFAGAWPTAKSIIGFGHPVYTISDPRSQIVKEQARGLAVDDDGQASVLDCRAH